MFGTPEDGRLVIDVHGDLAGISYPFWQGRMGLWREPWRVQVSPASVACRNTKAAPGGRPMSLKLLSK
jgi:hypothetical protein